MSRSNRLYNLALRGCLIAAVLWAGLAYAQEGTSPTLEGQPVSDSGQQTSEGEGTNQSQQTEPSPEKISPALNQIEAAIRDLIAQERAAQGQGPEDHEISDLEAQEGMAFWAKAMFWATLAAVIVTLAGIVLIARTLHHTRRAANYGEGMLSEAKKTTRAAEDAVKVTSDTAQRQLRAYVTLSKTNVEFVPATNLIKVTITVKNTGQTPALTVHKGAMISANLPDAFGMEGEQEPDLDTVPAADLGSGIEQPETYEFRPKDMAMFNGIRNRTIGLFVWGEYRYWDIFKKVRRHTRYRLVLNDTKDSLSPYPGGNEVT